MDVEFEKIRLKEDISKDELKELIISLNENEKVGGIMLLLPLPKHLDEEEITNLIDPAKDLDCLSDASVGRFYKGKKSFVPCTPYSVITLLKEYNIEIEG